jgi:rod shape determining protein RodA
MWDHRYLWRVDLRLVFVVLGLMFISLLTISSMTMETAEFGQESFWSHYVMNQLQWFLFGWGVFFFFAGLDYQKFYKWAWFLYLLMVVMLLGLYLARPIQSVHRWYRIPFLGVNIQPSEYAKLIVVITLGWFLNRNEQQRSSLKRGLQLLFIVMVPFLLILKQPDLGTALVLYPIFLVMCYFGKVHRWVVRGLVGGGLLGLCLVTLLFSGTLSHEKMAPFFLSFLKEYQYERLKPNNYHQRAAQTAIAIGGVTGSGWHKSEFSARKWLPAAHTDSVFAAYTEEFGLMGCLVLLILFYALIYFSFQTVAVAKEEFGHLLSSGVAVYLSMHIIVNIAIMCGFLPVSGVPLVLVSYGGSSTVTTMAALGILQSIYTRRFMF